MIGIVLLVGMYIVSLIAALCKSELAHSIFMLSLYCSIAVPVIIYGMQMIFKMARRNKKDEDKKE